MVYNKQKRVIIAMLLAQSQNLLKCVKIYLKKGKLVSAVDLLILVTWNINFVHNHRTVSVVKDLHLLPLMVL